MSFFPRAFIAAESTAASNPLFRLLEDLDSCSRPVTRHTARPCVRVNTPRFNIEEFEAQYELTGEFPGFDHSSLNIEFSDPQTLTIRARTDLEEELSAPAQSGTATTAEPTDATAEVCSASPHQPTVEDEDNEKDTFVDVEKPQMNSPTTSAPQQAPAPVPKPVQKPRGTFHAYERRVGDYYREFKFPVRVEADAVTASMKNGILTVVVPKAPKYESRRVTVN
jgi:HSP20 family protein